MTSPWWSALSGVVVGATIVGAILGGTPDPVAHLITVIALVVQVEVLRAFLGASEREQREIARWTP